MPTRSLALAAVLAWALAACGGGGGGGGDDGGGGGGGPTDALPPSAQPATGPGSATYPYASVVETTYGTGGAQYWLFEPTGSGATPLPVVLFCHGWSVLDPEPYRSWLEHLARRGCIVVYPRYQASVATLPSTFTGAVLDAVDRALDELAQPGHAVPDVARFAAVGHSFGGVLAANYAALASAAGLPVPDAVMPCEPGTGGFAVHADYADIAAGTLLLCVAGEDDATVGTGDAERIFREATAVPLADKDFVLLRTDRHGTPALVADHDAPAAHPVALPPDAFDGRGFWRWFDALTDAAWYGTNRDQALGGTAAQRDLGTWSDGVPVLEPLVTDDP